MIIYDTVKTNDSYEMTNDVKSQIKFIEELDKIEKKKKDEAEREKLMKAAKVRKKRFISNYFNKILNNNIFSESVKR